MDLKRLYLTMVTEAPTEAIRRPITVQLSVQVTTKRVSSTVEVLVVLEEVLGALRRLLLLC
jgi:hypothetical protein